MLFSSLLLKQQKRVRKFKKVLKILLLKIKAWLTFLWKKRVLGLFFPYFLIQSLQWNKTLFRPSTQVVINLQIHKFLTDSFTATSFQDQYSTFISYNSYAIPALTLHTVTLPPQSTVHSLVVQTFYCNLKIGFKHKNMRFTNGHLPLAMSYVRCGSHGKK